MSDKTLLGLCGSLRKGAVNHKLMLEAARLHGGTFTQGSLRLPLYDGDVEENDGIPAEVETLAGQIKAADAIVIATPEYNKMIPGVLKNGLDWLSRVKGGVWAGKPGLHFVRTWLRYRRRWSRVRSTNLTMMGG